jgi:hypothetical protein
MDAPVLVSVIDNGSGQATATVTGSDTIRLYYRLVGSIAWTAGGSRTGSGTIVQTGLAVGVRYEFYAVSEDPTLSEYSAPSGIVYGVTATGHAPYGWTLAQTALRQQIAAIPAFISAVGAADAAAALAYVFIGDYADRDGLDKETFAVITAMGKDVNRRSGTNARRHAGSFRVLIEAALPTGYQAEDKTAEAEGWFKDLACAIADGLLDAADTAGSLLIREASIAEGPWRYEDKTIKHKMACWMQVMWGLD